MQPISTAQQVSIREPQGRTSRLIAVVSQMGRDALADLPPGEVLHKIISAIWSLLPEVRSVAILLKEGESLVFAAVGGEGAQFMQGQRLPLDTPMLAPVLQGGRPICVRNSYQSLVPFKQSTGALSFSNQTVLVTPLKILDNTLGCIIATYEGDVTTVDEDLFLLDGAASWAAISLTNSRQREELVRQLKDSRAILRINQALNSTLELPAVFKLIVDSAKELITEATGAVIHRLDAEHQTLEAVAVAGQTGSQKPSRPMKVGEGIAGQVLAEARLINVADLNNDPRAVPSKNPNLRALMVAPVMIGTEMVGTISVQSSQPGAFNEADERLLMTLGSEAGLAIKNARLFQKEHDQLILSEALEQAAVTLNRNLDLEMVLDNILAQVAQVVRCQNFNVMLIQGQQIQVVREWDQDKTGSNRTKLVTPNVPGVTPNVPGDTPDLPGVTPDLAGINSDVPGDTPNVPGDTPNVPGDTPNVPGDTPNLPGVRVQVPIGMATLQKMIKTSQPVLIPDTHAEPLWEQIEGSEWIHSYVGVPLKVGDLTLGFLNAGSDQPNFFGPEIVPVLQSFAVHATIAIQNARLVQDMQNSLKQEKSMRVQLTKADRLATMGMITASVAHEINNPIQAVLGCLELAQMDELDREKQHEYLVMAKQELLRLASITKRVLNYQPSSQQPTSEPVELTVVVEDVIALARKKLQHAKIVIHTDYPASVPLIMGSPNELKQVFLNMVLNAIDAMGNGGRLNVSLRVVEQDGRWVQVIFNDTGEGIPPETLKRLFEPFFSTKETGTGLGLWISRDIITAHNGKIDIDSTVDVGTTFTIWLPY